MKCNNENHKHEQDEWNCPLTPLDIAIRQSPSYLSQAPKEDILTKKINTQPPRHEFWQSRIYTALMSVISLSAVIGSVSAYLYFKFVPIIEKSSDFNRFVSKYEKYAIQNLRKHKLQRKTISSNNALLRKKADLAAVTQSVEHSNIQNTMRKKTTLFNLKAGYQPTPLLLLKGKHAEHIIHYKSRENLLLIKNN